MAIEQTIAKNLRKYRKLAGFNQTEAAERIGVAQPAVSDWERGVKLIGTEYLKIVADVYGVSIDELFAEEDESERIRAMTESLEALPVF